MGLIPSNFRPSIDHEDEEDQASFRDYSKLLETTDKKKELLQFTTLSGNKDHHEDETAAAVREFALPK
jgi:hypothetical protein